MSMTGIERTKLLLSHKPADHIGLYEHFWNDTYKAWLDKGYVSGESYARHFNFDIDESWAFNCVADLDFTPVVLDETEDTILTKDGNGAMLRRNKLHDATPEHVGFTVTDRDGWEEYIKPILKPESRRINFEAYEQKKRECAEDGRFFVWSGIAPFEQIHPVCGHENMLVGMALDPEWVSDMAETYSDLTISLCEQLFSKSGKPDGLWFYEDMGFKGSPFMSPDMYRELIQPSHKKLCDYAHSQGLPVIMHSCGFVEPLLPYMVEAGIDCLQVIEVKAGMDLLRIDRNFGEKIALMGGIDVRTLYTNDRKIIDAELEAKIPIVKRHNGFFLHSDHSIPVTVNYDTYKYFIERGLELGGYDK